MLVKLNKVPREDVIQILEELKRVDTDGSGVITKEDFMLAGKDALDRMRFRSNARASMVAKSPLSRSPSRAGGLPAGDSFVKDRE